MRGLAFLARAWALAIAVIAAHPAGAVVAPLEVGLPAGFEQLADTQRTVADFSFGGRAIGQFEVESAPGRVQILDPRAVAAAVPGVNDPAALAAALSGPLDPNSRSLCDAAQPGCARPDPAVAAVVFDPRRFRAELWINPRLLSVRPIVADRYLRPADHAPSLVDTIAFAVAGGAGARADYDLRDRAILAVGEARFGTELSYSSGRGASLDTAAAALDRPGVRLTAGLFYASGADLVGRRRLLGAGIASQLDTRADRDALTGTPLVVFLAQRSRVDLYTGGRLVSSHSYEAGNQALDIAALPEGSFPVEIRIQEAGGATRVEHRFVTKDAGLPPPGRTLFYANAGLLAVDRPGSLLDVSRVPLATAGAARRVGARFAFDLAAMATDRRALAEAGLTWFTPAARVRAALLGASGGGWGAVLTANSAGGSRLGYTLDARRVGGVHGRPLIPLDEQSLDTFSLTTPSARAEPYATSSYTQLSAALFWQLGRAQLGASGYLRHDRGQAAGYAIGPTLHWPLLQRGAASLGFDGSWAATDRGRQVAFGLRFQLTGRRASVSASAGGQTPSGADGGVAGVAAVTGTVQQQLGTTRLEASAGAETGGGNGTLLRGGVTAQGAAGSLDANLIYRRDGGDAATQYGLSGQTSLVAGHGAVALGAQGGNESALVIRLGGRARVRFEVLVNDAPAGVVRTGGSLTLSVTPYRRYQVRLRPLGEALVAFDGRTRTVDAFPGGVAALRWTAEPVVAMFGRLVRPDGSAVANADLAGPGDALAATDDGGWFQIQAAADAVIVAHGADGRSCRAPLAAKAAGDKGFISLGTVLCRP